MMQKSQKQQSFWPILLAVFFGNFVAVLGSTTITIILPKLMDIYAVNIGLVQWTVTGFMLATGVIAPIVGYWCDMFSAKRLYVVALLGLTMTSVACVFSWNIYSLICFRICQGIFCGIIFPATMTIIYQFVEYRQQAFALSLWSTSGTMAPVLGPTLAGFIAEYASWQGVFLINVPLALLACLAAIIYIPNVHVKVVHQHKFDLVGLFSGVFGSIFLLYAFSSSEKWGMLSAKTIGLVALGVAVLVFFVRWELKREEPLLNFNVFRYGQYTIGNLVAIILTVGLNCSIFLMPIYLQQVRLLSSVQTGLVLLIGPLAVCAVSPIVGKLYHQFRPMSFVLVGMAFMTTGLLMLHQMAVDTSIAYIMTSVFVMETGLAIASVPATNYAMEALPANLSSHGAGINSWIKQGMGSLAIGLLTATILMRTTINQGKIGQPEGTTAEQVYDLAYTMGIQDVFLYGAIFVLVSTILTMLIKRKLVTQ